jgi:xylulokinase
LRGADAYERISTWAGESQPGAHGLLFLPYLAGERTPHMDPYARGVFLGLTAQHGRAELARAVMEGVVLACYDAYTVLAELGASPDAVVLAGGGAASDVWRQIVADVFGIPVRPLAVVEQSALGAAILAGAGIGWFDAAETAQAWARTGDIVMPDADRHSRYMRLLDLFRSAYRQNASLFRQLDSWRQE